MHLFDITLKAELGQLGNAVWTPGRHLLEDILDQLRGCELVVPQLDELMTNSAIERIEKYVERYRENRLFGDRRSLIAEYRRVWNLMRYALAETPQMALGYIHWVTTKDETEAANRLSQRLGLKRIKNALEEFGSRSDTLHPKIACLLDVLRQTADQKVIVVCTTKVGAAELAATITSRSPFVRKAIQLHRGVKKFEKQFIAFSETESGVAVATATLGRNVGIVADTVVYYNLLSPNPAHIREFAPLPRLQSVLVAIDHQLDLGRGYYQPNVRPRIRGIAPSRRRRKSPDTLTPVLPFEGVTPRT